MLYFEIIRTSEDYKWQHVPRWTVCAQPAAACDLASQRPSPPLSSSKGFNQQTSLAGPVRLPPIPLSLFDNDIRQIRQKKDINSRQMAGLLLPLTLLSFSLVSQATTVGGNQTCSLTSQKLQVGTYAFFSSCDPMFWCNSSSICDWKGCKRDDFPFGYGDITPPPKCPTGSFCPDEESACQPVLAVGSPCQLNRDGESISFSNLPPFP